MEELVGRPDLGVESRGASEIGDFAGIAGVTGGEFSMEACGFGCEVAGIWLSTAESVFEILLLFWVRFSVLPAEMILTSTFCYFFHYSLRNSC